MRFDFKRRIIKNKGWKINDQGRMALDAVEYFKAGYRGYGETVDEARFWVSKKEDLPEEEFKTEDEWAEVLAKEEADKKAYEEAKKAEEKPAKKPRKKATKTEADSPVIVDKVNEDGATE